QTPSPVSPHQLTFLLLDGLYSSRPVDHTCQRVRAGRNFPLILLCFLWRIQQLFRKPAPCCLCQFHALARQEGVSPRPDEANAPLSPFADFLLTTHRRVV